jgi:hypothetical protein
MRLEDELQRQRFEINVWPELDPQDPQTSELPHSQLTFTLPIQSSSAAGHFTSSHYGSKLVLGDHPSSEMDIDAGDATAGATNAPTGAATAATAAITGATTNTTTITTLYPQYNNDPEPFSQSAVSFSCSQCDVERASRRRVQFDQDVCEYCHFEIPETGRLRFCQGHNGEALESSFRYWDKYDDTEYEGEICSRCRG